MPNISWFQTQTPQHQGKVCHDTLRVCVACVMAYIFVAGGGAFETTSSHQNLLKSLIFILKSLHVRRRGKNGMLFGFILAWSKLYVVIRFTIRTKKMSDSLKKSIRLDKDCRRIGIERRMLSYSLHIPERRSHKDRRCTEAPALFGRKSVHSSIRQKSFQQATRAQFNQKGA